MKTLSIVVLAVLVSVLASLATSVALAPQKTQDDYIKDFYFTENAVHVSPHSLRGKMDKGVADFVLVDLRSAQEYEKEHVVGAVNIPAYKNPDTSAYDEVDRIVNSFKKLKEDNTGKDIVVYCYSIPCMTGRKIGKMLVENGVFVKQLGIGWNEWRFFWDLWNHEHEWNQTDVMDYIATGVEPGLPKIKNSTGVCSEGTFGC